MAQHTKLPNLKLLKPTSKKPTEANRLHAMLTQCSVVFVVRGFAGERARTTRYFLKKVNYVKVRFTVIIAGIIISLTGNFNIALCW